MTGAYVEQMTTHGYVVVDRPSQIDNLSEDAMDYWKRFYALPAEIKSQFVYTGDTGAGYECREEKGNTKDIEETFHVTLKDSGNLLDTVSSLKGASASDQGVACAFIQNALSLIESLTDPILAFAYKLENGNSTSGLRDEVLAAKGSWFLRFLRYPPVGEANKIIAARHVDQSGMTVYVRQTTAGVQYYDLQKRDWFLLPNDLFKMNVTANMQLQYRSMGDFTGLDHRVVSNETSAEVGRDSIVCFIPFPLTPKYNKEKYGRLQDMPVAFNYRMQHSSFSRYFTK